jgi:hypothetical protein
VVGCAPACKEDEDCVGSSCVLRWAGMTCSASAVCPDWATCCDGSTPTCDGTRIAPGDSTYVDGNGNSQYVVSADELTVTDTITGLVWQRDGSGPRTGCTHNDILEPGNTSCNWSEADTYCRGLSLGGFSDWRLPSLMELITIKNYIDFYRIDPVAFPDTASTYFWASSPTAVADAGWVVNFQGGGWYEQGAQNFNRVRCVR